MDIDKDRSSGASQFPDTLPERFGESEVPTAPETEIEHDPRAEWTAKRSGMGLALSGGGFRATLFGLGSLWRLNELGLLKSMTRITGVSGGSLAAGVLAAHWTELTFSPDGRASNFEDVVVARLREFCSRTLDWKVAFLGLLPFLSAARLASRSYGRHLTRMTNGREATLGDLPAKGVGPDFVFYATCMQTGSSFRLSRDGLYDWKLGSVRQLTVPLAQAMAASAGFPPVLAPLTLRTDPTKWTSKKTVMTMKGADAVRRKLFLSDGGVYDNMGIEALWKTMQCVLVSDAGAPFEYVRSPFANWFGQLGRVRDVLIQQTRALRKRMLMADFSATPTPRYAGAYWGIGSHISAYNLDVRLCSDSEITAALPLVSTRLKGLDSQTQERLINWGYALADTAIRRHVDSSFAMGTFPYSATKLY